MFFGSKGVVPFLDNPKYKFIKDYLNNFLKDKKGKVNISSVELAKDIVKKSKGKKFSHGSNRGEPGVVKWDEEKHKWIYVGKK